MTPAKQQRSARKSLVFWIMYSDHPQATMHEGVAWRLIAADFINGKRDDCPLTLSALRKELSNAPS